MTDEAAVVAVATVFVQARRRVAEATNASLGEALTDRDLALHDLTLLLGEPCDCDEGTCPGLS